MHEKNRLNCRILSVKNLSGNILILTFELQGAGFKYRAGQYIDLVLSDGSKRSFSIANKSHSDNIIELHIRYQFNGIFVSQLLDSLHQENSLVMEGPFGDLYFRNTSLECQVPSIFIASGTGFSTFKAIIEEATLQKIQRPLYLYWGGRTKDDLYLKDWVHQQKSHLSQLFFVPVLSEAKLEDQWSGRIGYVHHAVMEDFDDLSSFQVYVCGAPVVVESARRDLVLQRSLSVDNFFS